MPCRGKRHPTRPMHMRSEQAVQHLPSAIMLLSFTTPTWCRGICHSRGIHPLAGLQHDDCMLLACRVGRGGQKRMARPHGAGSCAAGPAAEHGYIASQVRDICHSRMMLVGYRRHHHGGLLASYAHHGAKLVLQDDAYKLLQLIQACSHQSKATVRHTPAALHCPCNFANRCEGMRSSRHLAQAKLNRWSALCCAAFVTLSALPYARGQGLPGAWQHRSWMCVGWSQKSSRYLLFIQARDSPVDCMFVEAVTTQ